MDSVINEKAGCNGDIAVGLAAGWLGLVVEPMTSLAMSYAKEQHEIFRELDCHGADMKVGIICCVFCCLIRFSVMLSIAVKFQIFDIDA